MMKAIGSFIAASVLGIALSGCHSASKAPVPATPPTPDTLSPAPLVGVFTLHRIIPPHRATQKANGATVDRIPLRDPIRTPQGIINVVFRIRNRKSTRLNSSHV